jgi:transcription initiation factor IIE alpha subunit
MENLIEDLIKRLEQKSKEIETQIEINKKEYNDTIILFLAGKIVSFNMCIDELTRLLKYYKGG